MKGIIPAENLPEKEKVYLKRDFLGWRLVSPIRNEDGSYNWFNLIIGGKRNLFILGMFMFITLLAIFAYSHDVNAIKDFYAEIAHNPTTFCNQYMTNGTNRYSELADINISITQWRVVM